MLRSTFYSSFLVFCVAGCFSDPGDPVENGDGNGSGGGRVTSTSDGTTAPTGHVPPSSTGSETVGTVDTSSNGSSTGKGLTSSSSTAGDSSSSTGGPPSLCGCPDGPLLFCETFETFNDGVFQNWVAPSSGEPPQQVTGLCGNAFRGEITQNQSVAVISRRLLGVLGDADAQTDVIRLRGLIRLQNGCANDTPHRLLSARTDEGPKGFLYSAEIELNAGQLTLVQRLQDIQIQTDPLEGDVQFDVWLPFEVSLLGLQPGMPRQILARVGEGEVTVSRFDFPIEDLSFSVIPGPFTFSDPAGCIADFDNVSVDRLPIEP